MTLTDEELDALAERLLNACMPHDGGGGAWRSVAREAARWAEEQQGERLEPLRVAVEAYHAERRHGTTNSEIDAAFELYNAARTLLEQTE